MIAPIASPVRAAAAAPSRRGVLGVALAALTVAPAAAEPLTPSAPRDPVFAALRAVRAAEADLTAALADLDEADPVALARADEAADRSGRARKALTRTPPETPAGFRALVRFHAADLAWLEPDTFGALACRDIAAAMEGLIRARASPG